MVDLTYRVYQGENVDFLKPLVDELMTYQAEKASIHPEIMKSMNYNNRLKQEYQGSENQCMMIAYIGNEPIGFAYATVNQVTSKHMNNKPIWAESLHGLGFYPDDYDTPKSIGTFKLLYVKKNYRGLKIGKKLSDDVMIWLKSKDIEDIWVYVANGNEKVGEFYKSYDFQFSHSVYNGFIDAYRQKV